MKGLMKQSSVRGKVVAHRDVIHHDAMIVKFSLWERIRVLFGFPVIVRNRLYSENERCRIVAAETFPTVPSIKDYLEIRKKMSQNKTNGAKQG